MFQVLMVEDSKNAARLMKAVLERAGFEVYETAYEAEALEMMDSTSCPPIRTGYLQDSSLWTKYGAWIQTLQI